MAVHTLKLTSRRQATFPAGVSDALGIRPGDTMELEPKEVGGQTLWVLKPLANPDLSWIGCLKTKSRPTSQHSMEAVRASILTGRSRQA